MHTTYEAPVPGPNGPIYPEEEERESRKLATLMRFLDNNRYRYHVSGDGVVSVYMREESRE